MGQRGDCEGGAAHHPRTKLLVSLMDAGGTLGDAGNVTPSQHRCVTIESMPSVTSSFRMSKELQRVLADAAQRTGKGKNAIIIEALVKHLKAMERESLAEEARRQSELVSRNEQEADWYGMADTSGWS